MCRSESRRERWEGDLTFLFSLPLSTLPWSGGSHYLCMQSAAAASNEDEGPGRKGRRWRKDSATIFSHKNFFFCESNITNAVNFQVEDNCKNVHIESKVGSLNAYYFCVIPAAPFSKLWLFTPSPTSQAREKRQKRGSRSNLRSVLLLLLFPPPRRPPFQLTSRQRGNSQEFRIIVVSIPSLS